MKHVEMCVRTVLLADFPFEAVCWHFIQLL